MQKIVKQRTITGPATAICIIKVIVQECRLVKILMRISGTKRWNVPSEVWADSRNI